MQYACQICNIKNNPSGTEEGKIEGHLAERQSRVFLSFRPEFFYWLIYGKKIFQSRVGGTKKK